MPVDIFWTDETRTCLQYDFYQNWTVTEMEQAERDIGPELAQITAPIDMIIHDHDTTPPDNALNALRRRFGNSQIPVRHVVIVTNTAFGRTLSEMIRKLSGQGQQVIYKDTVQDALDYIHQFT